MQFARLIGRCLPHCWPSAVPSEAWGSQGRSLGKSVLATGQIRWLRLVIARTGELAHTFWNGNIDAERHLPGSILTARYLDGDGFYDVC